MEIFIRNEKPGKLSGRIDSVAGGINFFLLGRLVIVNEMCTASPVAKQSIVRPSLET